tara:strand:- start:2333 stop:2737 length:405 start_codon:yes stop_codon:yes gene_type:complete
MMTLHEAHDALTIAASALEHSEAKKEFKAAKKKLEASLEFKAHKAAKELLDDVSERYKDSAKTFSNRKFGKGHLVKNAGKRTLKGEIGRFYFATTPVVQHMRCTVEPYVPEKHDSKIMKVTIEREKMMEQLSKA